MDVEEIIAEFEDFNRLSRRNTYLLFMPLYKNMIWRKDPPGLFEEGSLQVLAYRDKYGVLTWYKTPQEVAEGERVDS